MKAAFAFFVLLVMLCSALPARAESATCAAETVVDGAADLRCWNGTSPVALSGQWHLDYRADREDRRHSGLVTAPMPWQHLDPPLPFTGHGVYRIALQFSAPMEFLGLKLSRSNMARKVILIDEAGKEKVVFDSGNTGFSDTSVVNMRMPVVSLPYMGRNSELVIVVRNSDSVHGGIEGEVILGPLSELIRIEHVSKLSAAVISAILAGFFFVNIALWRVRGHDWALLTLSLLALFTSLRQSTVSNFLYDIFPELSTRFDSTVGWGTFFGIVVTAYLYFRSSYPDLVPRWTATVLVVASVIGIGLLVAQPLYIVQTYGIVYRPIVIFFAITLIGLLSRGLHHPSRELKITLLSGSIMVTGFVADIVYFQVVEYYSIISLSAVGLLVFIGTQTVLMSQRYWSSLRQTASLVTELKDLNANLEDKVKERTSELAVKNKQLKDLANTDPLTGLANRRAFDEAIRKELLRSRRGGHNMVIGIVDLDHFKSVNDRFGHDVGDAILKEAAGILKDGVRSADLTCRWGGEEFCILFPETHVEKAFTVSDRIRQRIARQKFSAGTETISVTASIGLAQWTPGQGLDDVFKAADEALYQSKEAGRNRVTGAEFEPALTKRA